MANVPSVEVQQLLAAEKRATEKVSDARIRKAKLLKRAKEEAAAEIEEFKAEKQLAFNQYQVEHVGSTDNTAKKIERETVDGLASINDRFAKARHLVLDKLINTVIESVKPRLHPNQRPAWGLQSRM